MTAYRPLCSQTWNVGLIPQQILAASVLFNTGLCGTGLTGELNGNVRMVVKVDNVAPGDIVTVKLGMGLMAGNWVKVGNTTTYKYTIVAADLVNSTHISISAAYSNPTFTTSSNTISSVTLSRILSNQTETIYAVTNPTNLSIPICQVSSSSLL